MEQFCPTCNTQRLGNYCHHCGYNYNRDITEEELVSMATMQFSNELSQLISDEITDDKECIGYMIETVIKGDWSIRSKINNHLLKGDYQRPLILVKEYFQKKRYMARTCRHCGKKNIVLSAGLLESECFNCHIPLINKEGKTPSKQVESTPYVGRKCVVCGNPVAPVSKLYCYSHFAGYGASYSWWS